MADDILHLRYVRVRQVIPDGDHYHVEAESLTEPNGCSECGGDRLHRHSVHQKWFRDLPIHAKQVGIHLHRQRWRCLSCGNTFFADNPDIDPDRFMTARLLTWMKEQSIRRPFKHIAEEVGVVEGAVRAVFRQYCNELEAKVRIEAPEYLGIDEIHLIRRPRCVIGNIRERTIVDLLPTRNKDAVVNYLSHLEGRERIRYAAIDMWRPYRDALQAVTPKAVIVVDKFHVVRMANSAMDQVRKNQRAALTDKRRRALKGDRFTLLKRPKDLSDREQLILSGWCRNFPMLGDAYTAKEAFFDIYEAQTRAEAERRYEAWRNSLPESIAAEFSDLVRAVDNWGPWIFTYFDHRITNAFSESINNLIRLLSRLGRGYSFEALRAKVLYTDQIHKVKKPRLTRKKSPFQGTAYTLTTDISRMTVPTFEDEREINYGVDISLLIDLLESDDF